MEIVLVHPLIPPNTGSIGRLCAATGTRLVLVEPLGFSLDDKQMKRAGLDYWPWIDLKIVPHWREALLPPEGGPALPGKTWLFTSKTKTRFTDVVYGPDDRLVFGAETTGLPQEVMEAFAETQVTIPMDNTHVRSLNLAQSAAVGLYEARRQLGL